MKYEDSYWSTIEGKRWIDIIMKNIKEMGYDDFILYCKEKGYEDLIPIANCIVDYIKGDKK